MIEFRLRARLPSTPMSRAAASEPASEPSTTPIAEQQPGGRAGEGQLADRVDRERQVAGHDEDADQAAGEAEHGAGDDRVPDQREQLAVVGEREELAPQRGEGVVHQCPLPSPCGACSWPSCAWSGSPTTMMRSRTRTTSTGVS